MPQRFMPALEIWSPLPPLTSGVADYVHEQLEFLERAFDLTLVAQNPEEIAPVLRERYRVMAPAESNVTTLRLYHIGNSPIHLYIYREALRVPGVVLLHEWNLHELLLGAAVASQDFDEYRRLVRREHGERGSVAAETVAAALGGRYWTSVFPLNAEVLTNSLAVIGLSNSTAARCAAQAPGLSVLHLPHHCVLKAHASNRWGARKRLGISERERVVLTPGLGTSSKSLDVARAALSMVRERVDDVLLVTAGGGPDEASLDTGGVRALGRVELETLGDALLAADVVLALRFPSRGEASGVVMRALAASRAVIVSSGSTADEDLPEGAVARISPGPSETQELADVLEFLLRDSAARERLERLSLAIASTRSAESLTGKLAAFLGQVAARRAELEALLISRNSRAEVLKGVIRDEVEWAARSLGLAYVPPTIFERLAGL